MKNFMLSLIVVFGASSIALADDDKLAAGAAWTNQDGSTFTITNVASDGTMTGTYINRAPGWGCQGSPYPLTGMYNGQSISFTVNWDNAYEDCNAITAWTGFFKSNGKIATLWQLVDNSMTSKSEILQGADAFTSTSSKERKSLTK